MRTQKIVCACDACALRFQDVVEGRFKLIPRDTRALPDFAMADADWENFALPINLAFFFYSTPRKKMMAYYPSPAGATESLLPLGAWTRLIRANQRLETLRPDVEALLVYKRPHGFECHIVPIDACYALVGRVRRHWKGFVGAEMETGIEVFFDTVRTRGARSVVEATR